jgi:hypothetical protein
MQKVESKTVKIQIISIRFHWKFESIFSRLHWKLRGLQLYFLSGKYWVMTLFFCQNFMFLCFHFDFSILAEIQWFCYNIVPYVHFQA